MNVEPIGLPAALKAWREREPEPVMTVRCGGGSGCGVHVGAVYRTPGGLVLESRLSAPVEQAKAPPPPPDLAEIAGSMDVVGMLAGFEPPPQDDEPGEETVRAQIDVLHSDIYWQDPSPLCPEHGALRVDHDLLAEAVRAGQDDYVATPA